MDFWDILLRVDIYSGRTVRYDDESHKTQLL